MSSWNYDMSKAPKDNTLLQLLVKSKIEELNYVIGFDDDNPSRTMGFNNFDNDGEDVWKFPGWDWCHDCITEQGLGEPIAWALMLELPEEEKEKA